MPTIGYAAAEIYYSRIRKKLSKSSPEELESIIHTFESKKLYKKILNTAFWTKTYLDYSAAKEIIESQSNN